MLTFIRLLWYKLRYSASVLLSETPINLHYITLPRKTASKSEQQFSS